MNRIYLIDNNIFYSSSLQSQLRAINHDVFLNHGDLGKTYTFRNIIEYRPNIIIMDLKFPTFDGFSLLHSLQNNQDTNNIPVIVYTSESNQYLEDKSNDHGVWKFFIKEKFTPEYLVNRLGKIFY